jgi:integrase
MAVYRRQDSRFYWMSLERPGLRPVQKSTKVPIDAPTPGERRDQKALATRAYNAAMGDLARKRHQLPGDRPTIVFKTYVQWYRENFTVHKRGGRREHSILRKLIDPKAWGLADYELHHIDKGLIIERRNVRAKQVGKSTVDRETDTLKDMFSQAVPKYLDRSPIFGLSRFRVRSLPTRIFTEAEEIALFAAAETLEEQAIMLIARDTLMRMSDVKNLEWRFYLTEFISVVDPKETPYTVPVSDRLRDVLEALRAEQRAASAKGEEGRFVFPRRQRGPGSLSTNTIHLMFVRMCKRAGVLQGRKNGGVTFHSLRHTGATRALERGVPLRGVQGAGGWANSRQLDKRYGHLTDEMLKVFRDKVGGEHLPRPGAKDDDTVH